MKIARFLPGLFVLFIMAGAVQAGPVIPVTAQTINNVGGEVSFRAKLQRLAKEASLSNTIINPPWLLPPAWATGQAVLTGQEESSSGHWWVAASGGTTGATAPAAFDIPNVVSDGAVQWLDLGAPSITANDALAPTVTRSTTNPCTSLTSTWGPWATSTPGVFKVYGGYQNPAQTSVFRQAVFNTSSGNLVGAGGKVAFWSDGPKVCILTGSNDPVIRINVDGRVLDPGGYTNGSGNTYTLIDWTAVGGRKARLYEVEGSPRTASGFNIDNVQIGPKDTIWAPQGNDSVKAVVISDSFFAGSTFSPYRPGMGIAQQLCKRNGWADCWNMSIGGTGWIATNSGANYSYIQRLQDATNTPRVADADIIVFVGSTNDDGNSNATVSAAVVTTLQYARSINPKALILVYGTFPVGSSSGLVAAATAVDTAVGQGVAAFVDPANRTYFITLANAAYPYIISNYNRPANVSSAANNYSLWINVNDFIHPVDYATTPMAGRMADDFRTQILPTVNY